MRVKARLCVRVVFLEIPPDFFDGEARGYTKEKQKELHNEAEKYIFSFHGSSCDCHGIIISAFAKLTIKNAAKIGSVFLSYC